MRSARALPAVFVLLALAGCTAATPPSPSLTQPFALAIDHDAVVDALGPLPPDEVPGAERLAAFRRAIADLAWKAISASYPDAERYAGPVGYLPDAAVAPAIAGCVAARGPALPEGGTDDEALAKAAALTQYACSQQFVRESGPGLSAEQVGYLFDYQARFVLPCYAEKGHPALVQPIPRDEYVANWPFQSWSPEPSGVDVMTVEYDQLELMCPSVPDEWR